VCPDTIGGARKPDVGCAEELTKSRAVRPAANLTSERTQPRTTVNVAVAGREAFFAASIAEASTR
jgi:hypothetical protein